LVLLMFLGSSYTGLQAQEEYQSLTISSGFNEDVIAENGPASDFTTASIDGNSATTNYAFMTINYPGATVGLPANGIISSEAIENLQFKFSDYASNNALKLIDANDSGTLEFATPQPVNKVFI